MRQPDRQSANADGVEDDDDELARFRI
jgi:hypothetical protein